MTFAFHNTIMSKCYQNMGFTFYKWGYIGTYLQLVCMQVL